LVIRLFEMPSLSERARLLAIGPVLTNLRPDPTLDRLVEDAARTLGAALVTVSVVLSKVILFRAAVGLPSELQVSRAISRTTSASERVLQAGRTVRVRDLLAERAPPAMAEQYAFRSFMGAPLRIDEHIVAVFLAAGPDARTFTDEEAAAFEATAAKVEARLRELATSELTDEQSEDELPLVESAALARLAFARRSGAIDVGGYERGVALLSQLEDRHFRWREVVATLLPLASRGEREGASIDEDRAALSSGAGARGGRS
jgi:GAF domain-containing protein